MSLFGNVAGTLISSATKTSDNAVIKATAVFKEKLNSQEKFRIFVAGSNGLGHQSTTVHVMMRLIFGFEYFKAIEVYYEEKEHPDKSTKEKLIDLIPELTNDNFDTGIKIGPGPGDDKKATITFIKFNPGTPPSTLLTFGFTGGADDKQVNYAKKLKTTYFLRLQPLNWTTGPNEIEFLEDTKQNVELAGIVNSPFFYSPSTLETDDWTTMKASKSGLAKKRIELAEVLFNKLKGNSIFLMPVYGIRDDGKMQLGNGENPEIFLFSLLVPLLSLLKESESFFQNKKVVLVSFGEIKPETFDKVILGCKDLLAKWKKEQEETREKLKPNTNSRNWCNRKVIVYTGAIDFIESLSLATGLEALFVKESTTVDNLSSLIDANPRKVLYLQLGGIPTPAFDYFYSKANLPTIFEGQGTAAKAACYGIPYLQLTRFGNTDKYPKDLEGDGGDGYKIFNNAVEAVLIAFPPETLLDDFVSTVTGTTPEARTKTCKDYSENRVKLISDFIKASLSSTSNTVKKYMALLKNQYGSEKQDKLLNAIVELNKQLPVQEMVHIASHLSENLAAPQQTLLETLLNRLTDCISRDKSLKLLDALSPGRMKDFYAKIINDSGLLINNATITPVYNSGKALTKVTVAGNTDCFGLSMKINSLDFTELPAGLMSHGEFVCMQTNSTWVLDGAPWIGLENPGFKIDVFDPPVPASGRVFGTLKSPAVKLSVGFPIWTQWTIRGEMEKPYPGISTACQLLGGIDITQSLPSPLNTLLGLGISEIEVTYNQENKNISSLRVQIEPSEATKWELLPNIYVNEFKIEFAIVNPGDLNNRQMTLRISGNVIISKGTIGIYVTYPNFSIFGNLDSGEIILSDLLNAFAPSSQIDLKSKVTQFGFSVEPTFSCYSLSGTLETNWPIKIGEETIFELDKLQLQIKNSNDQQFAMIGAIITLFPKTQNELTLSITTSWQSKDQNIIFEGRQTGGVVSLVDLLTFYLSDDWKPDVSYDIDGLGLTIETKTNSWKFTGKTAQPWHVPFIPELTVSASLTAGYNGQAPPSARTGSTVALPSPVQPVPGYFARLETDWQWEKIDIKVWFDYNPQVKSFGFTWNKLYAEVKQNTAKDWVGTLKFDKSVTIGGMVEDMVSWITGSRFSLGAPWNVLDGISLSGLELDYNFTQKRVGFTVNIGPIDFGFARIDSIGLSYQSSQPNPKDNGVMVTLNGSFFWQSNPDNPITWDASKPEQTPAPPGNGNKYLDLRLLAMGQHVTVEGLETMDTVEKAMELMATMPDPKPGEIPNVKFAPDSSWLFGADFGVLKLEASAAGDCNTLALRNQVRKSSDYFLTMQMVFNDPKLYALRIVLDGKPAKIFKGLDFQIMYRKISDTVGVYQGQITLPDIMRHLSVGAFTITLPVFAIAIYTNGDFQVDLGFPWNQNFARSFTVEAIIPPGIPVLGSAGLYFGMLSSATTTRVPRASNGTFKPVLVFGFGMQIGFGKSLEYGILSAGFSLTVVGIIEGVIAKWNPYQITVGANDPAQLQDEYYYWLSGTLGVIGRLYGAVDFGIIKANVNVEIKLLLQITYESYVSIAITVLASVDVAVSIKINLGLFSIRISFSFSMRLKETFTIDNSGTPPWLVENPHPVSLLQSPADNRLRIHHELNTNAVRPEPKWENLKTPEEPETLLGYLAPALTVARNEWQDSQDPKDQLPCYVAMLFIDSTLPANQDRETSLRKALGQENDTSFETFSKMVLRWAIAAIQDRPMSKADIDKLVIKETDLQDLLDKLTSADDQPTPIPLKNIEAFMSGQFRLTIQLPPDEEAESHVTYFPMAPDLKLCIPSYGKSYPGYSYTFAGYNSVDADALADLRKCFDQLAVQVQEEMKKEHNRGLAEGDVQSLSMAGWVVSDYFLLIARQMVQAAREALRDFKYPIQDGQTANQIVQWINDTSGLTGKQAYSLGDLFIANPAHTFTSKKDFTINNAVYQSRTSDTFDFIAGLAVYASGFTAAQLASHPENAANQNLLKPGIKITYKGNDCVVQSPDSLNNIAQRLKVELSELLKNSNLLSLEGLLIPSVMLKIPEFPCHIQTDDTLRTIAARYGVTLQDLASGKENGEILFDSQSLLDIPHLVQFQVGELIAEAQRSLAIQHLSGMASRYYLHGLRLPTKGITPLQSGMWVDEKLKLPAVAGLYALTGQQFPLPGINPLDGDFTITFDRSTGPAWLLFSADNQPVNQLTITLKPNTTDVKHIRDLKRIRAVTAYAQSTRLDTGLSQLGPEPMYQDDLVSFPFTAMMVWQSAGIIQLPYGDPPAGVSNLRLWKLPDAMRNLPDPNTRAVNPRFKIQLARYDEATGAMIKTPINYYGWASTITFTVKKIPPVSTSPATRTSYEIAGAGGNDILLMERLISQIRDNDGLFNQVILSYPPNQTGDSTQGVQTDLSEKVTMGIAQVNLSTETHPPANNVMLFAAGEEISGPGLLNQPSAFIRLLWEACITRSGGFYLYYYNAADNCGLPERIFNDKGEAELTLIVLYTKDPAAAGQNRLTNYMNAIVIGENLDTSRAVIFAQADPPATPPTKIPVTGKETLASLAYGYYSNVGDLARRNAGLTLQTGKHIIVTEGVYQVSLPGIEPGGDLSRIASHFGTTEQAIKAANPRRTDWPSPLPLYTTIRLPRIEVTVGSSPGGVTLSDIARYYGENLTALAAHNQDMEGLLAVGQPVVIPGGPTIRSATVPPGVAAMTASRPVPAEIPDDPDDPDFARNFLLNTFSLLSYQVVDNKEFPGSSLSLPAGPTTEPADPENVDKIRVPKTLTTNDTWDYKLAIPYYKIPPESNPSPYLHIGYLLQVNYSWQDLYGNTLITTLANPEKGDSGPLNQPPMLTGYTDALIGPDQWPSISMGWQVIPGTGSGNPQLQVQFSFDKSRYDESQTPSWQDNAVKDLRVYTRLYYQLNDPNGIGLTIATTLLPNSSISLDPQNLFNWILYGTSDSSSIYQFLNDRAGGGTSVPAPPPNNFINHPLDPGQVNQEQVFELSLSLDIQRTGGVVLGDFETTPGVKQTTTIVAPLTGNEGTLGLTQFAQNFQQSLSRPGSFLLKVATGVNRARISTNQTDSILWAVRLGLTSDQGISYTINNPATPAIFAPKPISNKLESRDRVPIYDYTTGVGLSPKPSRELKFVDIDMDLWGRQFLAAIDGVLTPELTAAIQIVDKNKNKDNTPYYLQQILDQKKILAAVLKKWLVPVYQDEDADPADVQEVFYQQLLSRLSNAYATKAAIQFNAKINADIQDSGAKESPRLFGMVVQKKISDSKNDGAGNAEPDSKLSLTSPKLKLKTGEQSIPFLLTAPEIVRSDDGAVLSNLTLNLAFDGSNIEHQIGSVSGIEGYEASSWLSFVIQEARNPLSADLEVFQTPLVLRSYPASPTMAAQSGAATSPEAAELDKLTLWNYSFTYTLPFHYPQDRVHCEVDFNIAEALNALGGIEDTFYQLAQFITVFPAVNADLEGILAGIDATTTDQTRIDKAAVALESFIKMVKDISDASRDNGLNMLNRFKTFTGTSVPSYNFIIQEGTVQIDNVNALLVTIHGRPPQDIDAPQVLIDPDKYTIEPYPDSTEGDFRYWYKRKSDGKPLSTADGQIITERRVVLQRMDILQRQDAWATVFIRRNEELVPGKITDDLFIYSSPNVQFANPLHPTIDTDQTIDISKIGSPDDKPVTRPFDAHLQALFDALLKNNREPELTLQVEVSYDYSINRVLDPVTLPVLMQAPRGINVKDGIAQMIVDWSSSINLWFNTYKPSGTNGTLSFDLTIMSNLTRQPMPLIRLRRLILPIQSIDPPLPVLDKAKG